MSVFDWSTTAADNDDADSNINWAEGQAPSTVNDSSRAEMARIAHWRNMLGANVTMGGTGNAYTYTTGESLSAYSDGIRLLWQPNANPTGAVTINVDAIGAKKVYMPDGTQAGNGDLDADSLYDIVYDSSLDSSAGAFKIVGFPDTTLTAADYLTVANNLSDVASASTALTNLGGLAASNNLSDVSNAGTARSNIAAYGAGDDPTFGDVTADTVASHVPIGGISSGTLDATNLGHGTNLSGNITIPTGIGSGQQTIGPLNSGGASRTITRGSGLSMYVNGTNVASCTLAARGLAVIWFQSSTFCYVIGDVY